MAEADAIRLIVGLGNPGSRYEQTRHNAGIWFVDNLIRTYGGRFNHEPRFGGEAGRIVIGGHDLWLFKPGTFMNRSGHALRLVITFYKIPLSNVLVAHDEIDLPPGAAKLKRGGGHGGHNGLRDIFAHVGQDFWRLRLGVGHPGHMDQVVEYVLSCPPQEDREAILEGVGNALAVVPGLAAGELERAMHKLHTR
jgi:PTH1 family peptidyl-tRNA hydrolase